MYRVSVLFYWKESRRRVIFSIRKLISLFILLFCCPTAIHHQIFFFTWLADMLKISDSDAPVRFNDFVYEVKKKIDAGNTVNWNGIGILSKGLAGEIKFVPINEELVLEQPVPAVKMIRDNAEHTMRVGEQERTSSEMMEILMRPEKRTSYWWTYGLAVGLLAIMFIGWYFSEHGLDVSSTANGQKLVPKQIAPTYRELK